MRIRITGFVALRISFLVALSCFFGTSARGASVSDEVLLEGGDSRLRLDHGHLVVERSGVALVDLQSIEFNFRAPLSLAVATKTAETVVLRAVYPAAAKYDEDQDLPVEIELSRVAGGYRLRAKPAWALNTTLRLRDLDDHFFGLLEPLYPNNRRSPDLRGQVVEIDAQGDQSLYHENYASIWSAFYMTNRGYASFFDTFARGRYRLGIGGETELYHRTGGLDWYILLGRDGDALLASYYAVIGAPKAPPLWALGPVGWRDENHGGAAEVLTDVQHMTELRIPFTAWWVDRPYSDGKHRWSKMNFNEKFAHPQEWIGRLEQEYHLKLMTWVAPLTFGDTDFPGLLPGDMGYLDLSNPAALAEFERRLAIQYHAGVRGHKMDRAEEYFPEMDKWKDGTAENESRNKYLFLYAKTIDGFLQRAWGAEHFNFARGAFHRTQPYLSAVWGGDARSSWDGLAGNLANAIRCGFMGFPVWGTDVGGNLGGRIEEELYARWLEWGTWNGFFEIKLDNMNGQGLDRPPWVYGEKLQSAFRQACELRVQLMPYIYSLARTSRTQGVTMKPLAYVWPDDPATYNIGDEYLFGSAFLVAPLTAPGGARSVYLPEGNWSDYYQPTRLFAGKQTITVTSPFDRIPVFVRANSMYITGGLALGNQEKWKTASSSHLVLHVAPGEVGEKTQFEFIDPADHDRSIVFTLERSAEAVSVTAPPLHSIIEVEVISETAPTATLAGRETPVVYDAATKRARVTIPRDQAMAVRWAQVTRAPVGSEK